jgi:hypothetical protein
MTFNRMILCRIGLRRMIVNRMTLYRMTLSKIILNRMTLSRVTLSIRHIRMTFGKSLLVKMTRYRMTTITTVFFRVAFNRMTPNTHLFDKHSNWTAMTPSFHMCMNNLEVSVFIECVARQCNNTLVKLGFSSYKWSRLLDSLVAQTLIRITDKKSSSILIY